MYPFKQIQLEEEGKQHGSSKKVLTKGQIVTHFAEKFEISKKDAASVIDEYAGLAIAETKKKGAFVLPGIGKLVLVKRKAR